MKRLPITGASLAPPAGSEDELKRALHKLGVADAFGDAAVHDEDNADSRSVACGTGV
jgi:hypothetical protein